MKSLRTLFTKQTAVKAPENPLKTLERLPQTTLEAIVEGTHGDPNFLELRVAAIQRLPYSPTIRNAALGAPSSLEKAARVRIAQLLDLGELTSSQVMQDIADTEKLLVIASYCKHTDFQQAILSGIEDQALLAKVCTDSPSAAVRGALAERINDPELLRDLLKTFKNKDKNVYRIAKSKLDAIKAQEDAERDLKDKIANLCADIEQHSQRVSDHEYLVRMERYVRRWSEVEAHASAADQLRFTNALNACKERAYAQEQKREQEDQAKVAQESLNLDASNKRHALLNELGSQLLSVCEWPVSDDDKQQSARLHFTNLQAQWRDLDQQSPASDKHAKHYATLSSALDNHLQRYSEKGTLVECLQRLSESERESPQDIRYLRDLLSPLKALREYGSHSAIGQAIESAQAFLKEQSRKEAALRDAKQKQIRVLGGLIRKGVGAVEQGRLKQALGIRHSIDEKLKGVDDSTAHVLPTKLAAQLESLDESIQKLIDWQAYAVVPKKESLVAAMESLVGADMPPDALATKIKNLQDEWKELAQSGNERQEDLWKRFSEAADKAYEPCKAYFKDLSALRKSNLEKRKGLVQQLQDYQRNNDWDNADWRQVEKILRTARQEFHSYAPVERGANKPLLAAFDDTMSAIQSKLQAEFDKNKLAKERLITQAETLTDSADLNQAIETIKRLQTQWKTIGHCQYKDNERLWKAFRKHCDNVFAKKEAVAAEQNAVLNGNLAQANRVIESLKKLTALNGEEFLATRAEKDQLKLAFREVGELPAKVDKAVQRNFMQVLDAYDSKVKQQLLSADQDAWRSLFSINAELNAYQLAAQSHSQDAPALKETVVGHIDECVRWPEGGLAKIKRKLEGAPEGTLDRSLEDNEKALHLLCIRAEIQAGIESPSADKAKRMEYQVNLLKKGLGQATAASPQSLALEWVDVGPVPGKIYDVLFQRFNAVWQKLV